MRTRIKALTSWLLPLFILPVVGGIAYVFVERNEKREPELYVASEQLDFGDLWETDSIRRTITVQNRNRAAIRIKGFASACSCLSIESKPMVLSPEDSAQIPVSLDLEKAPRSKPNLNEASVLQVAFFPIREREGPIAKPWIITGKVQHPFLFDKPRVDFGEVFLQGTARASRKLIASKNPKIRDCKIDYDKDLMELQCERARETAMQLPLEVTLKRSIPPGFHESRITLVGTDSKGQRASSACIVRFTSLADFHAIPSVVICGPRLIGEVVHETVAVASRTRTVFQIVNCATDSDAITASRRMPQETDGCSRIDVTVRVQELGPRQHHIKVHLSAPDGTRPSTVTLAVHIHGVRGDSLQLPTALERQEKP